MKEVDNIKDEEVNEDNVEEGNLEEDMTAKNSDQDCGRMDKLLRPKRSLHSQRIKCQIPKVKLVWKIGGEFVKYQSGPD